jgi:FkbM family methyltransferase
MVNWLFVRETGAFRWVTRYSMYQFHKRVLRREVRLRLPTGLRLHLPLQSRSATEVYVTNADMDWGAEALFARFADRRRDFLDIGSHIGYYAVYLSPKVRRVYAFEPDARNLPSLRQNAQLAQNIEVVVKAVSSFTGAAQFYGGGGSSVGSLNKVGGSTSIVSVTSVDDFTSQNGADPALIKTDIEGHDLEALRGMCQTVQQSQPLILTECELSADLISLCEQWEYRVYAHTRHPRTRKIAFRQFTAPVRDDFGIKMLFLVPARLYPEFAGIAA